MTTQLHESIASASAAGVVAVLALGILITGALVWAVRLGITVRRREPAAPRRGTHPTLPDSGPVREEREMREPDEVPRTGNGARRLTPHELRHSASRRSDDQNRPRWKPGSGGSFGGGR
ncbi:DUF6479 family protein [Streptomyces sp. NPDC058964]|uniref:DUF6479 family protein n=1 Tax=Streptomyces sp. NPDC058964 TaxID=3346681 RepID=UPI0036CB79B4